MGLDASTVEGQTPLSAEELEGIRIPTISTRWELDEFEQQNIENALEWTLSQKAGLDKLLSLKYIQKVHQQMFNNVWTWAGSFRKTNKNIGVDKFQIQPKLKLLFDDCRYWLEQQSFSEDEIAVRFKHRLVKIHPFPNGNGRHSRLCGDILISHVLNQPVFSWGRVNLAKTGKPREIYLLALRKADEGDLLPLLSFARS